MEQNQVFIGFRNEDSEVTVIQTLRTVSPALAEASPKLLEACRKLLSDCEKWNLQVPYESLAPIRTAIAAAEGRKE